MLDCFRTPVEHGSTLQKPPHLSRLPAFGTLRGFSIKD